MDLGSQRNYYAVKREDGTWDDSIEKLLGEAVESPGLPAIQKLASGKTRLTWQDRNSLSLLLAFQEMRTPAARERVRVFSKVLNERLFHEIRSADPHQNSVKLGTEAGSKTVTLEEMVKAHEEMCNDHSMEIHRPLMSAAIKLSEYYKHMKFTVHYPSGDEEFITTDTPVIRVFSNVAALGTGIDRSDVEVRFPLSRKAFLTLTHDVALMGALERASSAKRMRLLESLPETRIKHAANSEVVALNRAHARHARLWLFASRDLDWVKGVLSEASAAPTIADLSCGDLIHLQSRVNYDPGVDPVEN